MGQGEELVIELSKALSRVALRGGIDVVFYPTGYSFEHGTIFPLLQTLEQSMAASS